MSSFNFLHPGIGIKRWLGLGFVGITMAGMGVAGFLGIADPGPELVVRHYLANCSLPTFILLFVAGVSVCAYSFTMLHRNLIQGLTVPQETKNFASAYLQNRLLQRGPRIVTIGGGTGLSTILEGLKEHSANLTAVVTVSDDGGSSGRLRKDLAILPPGDIRNCLVSLARRGPLLSGLLQHRFSKGEGLQGHSFGNLLIAALTQITGNFLEAIRATSEVLAIAGEVLPATCQNVVLVARMEDGSEIRGESKIPKAGGRIREVHLDPPNAYPPQEVLDRIANADLILLGPGSLYTSVVPNLLVSGIADAVNRAEAPVVYISNIMTQPGETNEYSLAEHVHALLHTTPLNRIDAVLFNGRKIGEERLLNYERKGSHKVEVDEDFRVRFDIKVIEEDLLSLDGLVRHDPRKTAAALIKLLSKAPSSLA